MAFAIGDILNPRFFTDAYKERSELTTTPNPLLQFYAANPQDRDGGVIEQVYYPMQRTAAPGNTRGAPAKTLDLAGANVNYHAPIHVFNELSIDMNSMTFIRADNSNEVTDKGRFEILRQWDLFSFRLRQFKAAVLSKLLCDGICYFNPDYMVLESSSGADTSKTIDWSVPSNNKNQLNTIIGTRWDQAGANILQDLDQIRIAAESLNAEMPKHIWTNSLAKQWIRGNTELKSFMVLNSTTAEKALNGFGDTIQFGDWTWHFYDGTYVGADGSTVRKFIGDTKAIITPDPGPWFANFNTPELVPTSIELADTVDSAMGNFAKLYGDFSYAEIKHNPARLALFLGSNFYYGLANPNAIYCAVAGT